MSDLEAARDWHPAFHPAALRMVGGLLSDAVTRAIGSDTSRFRGPIWSEGRPALASLGEMLSGTLTMAIRREVPFFQEQPDWSRGSAALCRVFGLDRRHHLFRAAPIDWGVKFHEPQFTKGFAHFLFHGVPERIKRNERTRALLKALGVETALGVKLCKERSEAVVTAEESTSRKKRIDLLIEWTDSSKRIAVAIEAKLGHHVTIGQLPAYREHVHHEKEVSKECVMLIVVSPRLDKNTRDALRCQQGEWRWIAWRDLLIAHERALSGDYDDDAYRQFRRTLWDQAG